MADTKKTLVSIKNHLMKCTKCPDPIKDQINHLKNSHEDERRAQKYGSQKAFFSNIWARLHHWKDEDAAPVQLQTPAPLPLAGEIPRRVFTEGARNAA